MTVDYGILTYRGDVSGSEQTQVGDLFGWDEMYRPYEITDVEVYRRGEPAAPDSPRTETFCGLCERDETHTHVHIQYARAETLKEQGETFALQMRLRGLL